MLQSAIDEAARSLAGSEAGGVAAATLLTAKPQVCERFCRYFAYSFERLAGDEPRKIVLGDYPGLSLVDEQFLEAANAMEGMINYARNTCIKLLINFNTRLDELLPALSVDETNSPLDPDRIAQAFIDALAPLEIDRQFTLPVYRHFNSAVLRNLHEPLARANEVCIANGLLPELVIDGRSREAQLERRSSARPDNSPLDRAFPLSRSQAQARPTSSAANLVALIRGLLHGDASPADSAHSDSFSGDTFAPEVVVPVAVLTERQFTGSLFGELGLLPLRAHRDMEVAGRDVLLISRSRLLELLDQVQAEIIAQINRQGEARIDHRQFATLLSAQLFESSVAGTVNAIDGATFDTLLIISLLYETLCRDVSLVAPIKELILATQVVMMKVALHDDSLFRQANHPARLLLNEVASAGVCGLELDELREDPVYNKLEDLLIRLVMEYDGGNQLLEELLLELEQFKRANREAVRQAALTANPGARECQRRIAEINRYVRQKIQERVSEPLPPILDELVNTHYHQFLVDVVLRDGQGSYSWILVIKILDLLLWTVKSDKKEGDYQRFQRLNPMLLPNLRKALLNSGLQGSACDVLLDSLQEVQVASFRAALSPCAEQHSGLIAGRLGSVNRDPSVEVDLRSGPEVQPRTEISRNQTAPLSESVSGKYLSQVDKLPVGSWLRFHMEGDQALYCTLAARFQSMGRLVFVNSKGVKVVEKTRQGLALELEEGTAGIVSEWPLFERGLEGVVARLRERRR